MVIIFGITKTIKNGKETYPHYRYHLNAYNQKNEKKEVEFNSVDSVPLKKNAYLVLHINKKKGVIGWEEVKASKVPSIIINTLNHEASQQWFSVFLENLTLLRITWKRTQYVEIAQTISSIGFFFIEEKYKLSC